MEQNKTGTGKATVYLGDLLKLFVKKFKMILIVGIVVAIIGGAIGGVSAAMGSEYVAELSISISPIDDSDRLLFNLRTGRFAETLLLEENGLPPKDKCNAADYAAAVKALDEYEAAREARREKYYEMSSYYTAVVDSKYNSLKTEYDAIFNVLKLYKEAAVEGFATDENHLRMIAVYEEKLLAAEKAKNDYYNEYYSTAQAQKVLLQTELAEANDLVDQKKMAADEAVERVLAEWRKDPGVENQILTIMESTTYEYFDSNIPKADETKETTAFNKGYVKISISVPEDEEFANKLVDCFQLHLCDYVEEQLEYVTGKVEVECVLVDPVVTVVRTPDSLVPSITKYAAILGAVAVVATYLVYLFKFLWNIISKGEKKVDGD
ncbi:MAG: hypothetical protein E7589_04310 [Ruminococcaceae bacterium]|nr:hypothetical protein [Oscillospiraceae bacterium]